MVGLAPTKGNQVRLISEEGAFAAQPHMHDQISNFKFKIPDDFKSEIHLRYKIDEGRE